MTQLTFDFSTLTNPASYSVRVISKPTVIREPEPVSAATLSASNEKPLFKTVEPVKSPEFVGRSLSLYDANRTEIQHIGDLAHAVLARYDIVHRRRAARIARERAAQNGVSSQFEVSR